MKTINTERIAIYVLGALLLGLSIYLKSSAVAVSSVILMAVEYAKDILLKLQENNKLKELEDAIAGLRQQRQLDITRISELEKDVYAAVSRVKETLGDSI